MAGAESVIHVSIGQAGQLLAESGLILGLFLAETGVLQQNNIAVAHGGNSSPGVLADNGVIVSNGDGLAQLLAQADSTRGQAELGLGAVLRLAQVAAQNDLCLLYTSREQGVTEELVRMQVKIALNGVTADELKNVVIAYEPIWAIDVYKRQLLCSPHGRQQRKSTQANK